MKSLLWLFPPSTYSRRAVVSLWRKCVLLVLVNHLGGLSLPRISVARLTDNPDMTIAVYSGCKVSTYTLLDSFGSEKSSP